jgi:hypothetical protein
MPDDLTRHVRHMLAVTEELKKAIAAFRELPVPASCTPEDADVRNRLELSLFRVHIGLITAPAVTAILLRPAVH